MVVLLLLPGCIDSRQQLCRLRCAAALHWGLGGSGTAAGGVCFALSRADQVAYFIILVKVLLVVTDIIIHAAKIRSGGKQS
jgi:hypothetical protein